MTVSKALQRPVQVVWSREEDTRHGFYRPVSMSRFRVGLGKDGLPVQWKSQIAQPYLSGPVPMALVGGVHNQQRLPNHFYKVEGVQADYTPLFLDVPVGSWRSPPNSLNVFYTESVMDELAHLAGQDPLEYRLKLMPKSPKHRAVLEQVAKQAGWGRPLPEGRARGIAINDWFPAMQAKTVAAQVAEVSVSERGKLKVERVDCVVDCGLAVNPDLSLIHI